MSASNGSNELDNWEWQWQLAVKLSKNEGVPVEQEYWDGLEEKIMSEIIKDDMRKRRRGGKEANTLTRKGI